MKTFAEQKYPACRRKKQAISFFIALFLYSCSDKDSTISKNPYNNVILIVADDLGKEILSIYNSNSYNTANLNFLAKSCTIFDNCYANPICAPSRAELMTGLYPTNNGVIFNIKPGEQLNLHPNLGSLFKNSGYSTCVVGKWHLADLNVHPEHINKFSFDSYFVHKMLDGNHSEVTSRYFNPTYFSNSGTKKFDNNLYGPDLELAFAKDFLLNNRENPYFLYYALNLPHGPYTSPPGYPINANINDYDNIHNYKFLVEYMDKIVGNLITFLKEIGDYDNSLIVFTSDNGSPSEHSIYHSGDFIRGGKGTLKETGINVPLLIKYPYQTNSYRADRLVDFTDFIPTLKNYLQNEQFPITDGKSFIDIIDNASRTANERSWIFSMVLNQWAIRNKESKVYWDGRVFRLENYPNETKILNPSEIERKLLMIGDSIANGL
ncbi:sulfatase-like hydrolase/transferase [Ekhidna sp.]|uniref:sulfatase-like hydrolase/transferase n=1 Tax=Ekhidna sp. TaxID=2608089 RepID=UPI0032EE6444